VSSRFFLGFFDFLEEFGVVLERRFVSVVAAETRPPPPLELDPDSVACRRHAIDLPPTLLLLAAAADGGGGEPPKCCLVVASVLNADTIRVDGDFWSWWWRKRAIICDWTILEYFMSVM